jgi:3-polyprenyl-4-hydroxybenzoate decarboxylase
MGIGGCNKLCPVAMGHNWVALFLCPCQLRTVRCMDLGQVTDLLSRAHTCLWEREGLLLSCHRLRLFSDRLIGGRGR